MIERRYLIEPVLRVTQRSENHTHLKGHAALFNVLSEDLGGFKEKVEPGAFREAVRLDDVRALFNHDPSIVLGRNRAGTLKLAEDSRGLAVEIHLPGTQWAQDVATMIDRGDVTQMSFGFSLRTSDGQSWVKDAAGQYIRTIKRARLFDVSAVTFPAYRQTDIAVAQRSLEAFRSGVQPPTRFATPGSDTWRNDLRRRRLELEQPNRGPGR